MMSTGARPDRYAGHIPDLGHRADQGRLRTEFLRQNAESILFYAGCPVLLGRSKIVNHDGHQFVAGHGIGWNAHDGAKFS